MSRPTQYMQIEKNQLCVFNSLKSKKQSKLSLNRGTCHM